MPSTKNQTPNNFQVPNTNVLNESPFKAFIFVWAIGSLEFAACLVLGAWDLEF
jgi:hypothetical protein